MKWKTELNNSIDIFNMWIETFTENNVNHMNKIESFNVKPNSVMEKSLVTDPIFSELKKRGRFISK